ncbi:MAG: hypothetical protein IJM46_06815 [Oscillospiraceae bacterium]|nr:hypothetical protein [Oscillospiraceae bacterium]
MIKLIGVTIPCGVLLVLALLRIFSTIKEIAITVIAGSALILLITNILTSANDKSYESKSILLVASKRIPNYIIFISIGFVIVCCTGYLLYEYHSGREEALSKKELWITGVHNIHCAVIAADSDYLIAEEIMISDDSKSATIYSDSVFIIPKESEPVLEKKSFEKPPIVKAKGADE